MTFIIINLNTIKKVKRFYYISSFTINYILVFFSLIFKVYFNKLSKKFALKIIINIFLKYISNNLAIVFVTHDDFQNR